MQALQLVRGGSIAELRERSLLAVLGRLSRHGCLPAADAAGLEAAYRFLRLAENRLQAIADRQTHDLPDDDIDRLRLAFAMGYADWPAFLAGLQVHRNAVRRCFREVVFRGGGESAGTATGDLAVLWQGALPEEAAVAHLAALGFTGRKRRCSPCGAPRDSASARPADRGSTCTGDHRRGRQPTARSRHDARHRAIGRRSPTSLLNENPAALGRLVSPVRQRLLSGRSPCTRCCSTS